jgi:hypothetical protein
MGFRKKSNGGVMNSEDIWRHCGSCKKAIFLRQNYYECSVSTCKKSAYCSLPCFDEHSPVFRHKDAWALEKKAPLVAEPPREESRISHARLAPLETKNAPKDILIVGSKLKDYVRARSGLNTSAAVLERLSDMVRILCDQAIERAHNDSRKTLMDRDFTFTRNL